eukprot:3212853-Amphidinium_carterae.1
MESKQQLPMCEELDMVLLQCLGCAHSSTLRRSAWREWSHCTLPRKSAIHQKCERPIKAD